MRCCLCRLGATLLMLGLLGGCSIAEITRPDSYTVKRGDTLYSIAWRHEVDWREVARWNDIPAPYRIYPGQKLNLERYPEINLSDVAQSPPASPPPVAVAAPPVVVAEPTPVIRGGTAPRQMPRVVRLPTNNGGQAAGTASGKVPADPTSAEPSDVIQAAKVSRPAPPIAPVPPPAPARPVAFDARAWEWPTSGKLLRGYSDEQARQGVDIGGSAGQSIVASNAGRVVYSGSGLRGYGNLVIIKHNDEFLSAYGFNRALLVAEGQNVAPGQPIAEMGLGPRNEAMLHFEIRHDGKPVDPQKILPRR